MTNDTPSPEARLTAEEIAERLYAAFWVRNGGDYPEWNCQAQALKTMWTNIATDALATIRAPAPIPDGLVARLTRDRPAALMPLSGVKCVDGPSALELEAAARITELEARVREQMDKIHEQHDTIHDLSEARWDVEARASTAYKAGLEAGVIFVLSHYELSGDSGSAFTPYPIDPETWWSKVQLLPHNVDNLLPRSREHFERRLARWKELAIRALAKPAEGK